MVKEEVSHENRNYVNSPKEILNAHNNFWWYGRGFTNFWQIRMRDKFLRSIQIS